MRNSDSAEATSVAICGGVYHERCNWPSWDHLFGSAGRAAVAMSGHVQRITLRSYARKDIAEAFNLSTASLYNFNFIPTTTDQIVTFDYVHCLSIPVISPSPSLISQNSPIPVNDEVVLRFGMMEGSAIVSADRCIYDPQSAFRPDPFRSNGSKANHLAIVANRGEIVAMTKQEDIMTAAQMLISDGAEIVVVKSGIDGALVVDHTGSTEIPAFQTQTVWTIGSGDVFAAIFASAWGVSHMPPRDAALLASRSVADYVETMALPSPQKAILMAKPRPEIEPKHGRIYLAGPFFTLNQRWLIDEARRAIRGLGMEVVSPVHDIGPGPAEIVAPADLAELKKCDAVFAILDGLDSGTLFEVGYAHALGKPVFGLAQTVGEEDLKMMIGSGCQIYNDLVTALHHLAWRK